MVNMYILQGRHNTGKTETLVDVIEILKNKYPEAKVNIIIDGKDKKVIFTNIKGLTVGIETQGDPNSRLDASLKDFIAMHCDIIFCACRTKGKTVTTVNSYGTIYNLHFINQTVVAAGFSASNMATAKSLVKRAGL